MAAPKLKDFFDAQVVADIATSIAQVHKGFDSRAFQKSALNGLDRLELIARGWHIAEALRKYLPPRFVEAADVIVAALGPEAPGTDSFGMAPFRYLPHVFFVQRYGLDDFEAAMRAQYELTKRFSAESSIRAYLIKHPDATYARLKEWTRDPNPHVRRLVSEGTRPRLPWAPRLRAFQEDPRPVLALLELLKDDSERYVQRSVANSLNDIGKDHPDLAVAVCRAWSRGAAPGRLWLVRHALRDLAKKGHRGALAVLGVGDKPRIRIAQIKVTPASIQLGDKLRFSFVMKSTARAAQRLMVDYAVHFVKANGGARPKVFKLRKLTLAASASVTLAATISFKDLTTRRHYPGRHRIDVTVNGIATPLATVELRPRRAAKRSRLARR